MEARRQRGFTLLELLSVMAIMMIIAGITVTSYFGMVRGAGMRAAVSHLQSTLHLARQTAVMNGKTVHVVFGQSESNAWYVVVQKAGTVTWAHSSRRRFSDQYADWSNLGGDDIVGSTVYNLTSGESSVIVTNTLEDGVNIELETEDPIWYQYDEYGWEQHPRTMLPSKYQFGHGDPRPDPPDTVVFNGDGTTPSGERDIDIYESLRAEASGDPHATITVAGLTGFISVEYN